MERGNDLLLLEIFGVAGDDSKAAIAAKKKLAACPEQRWKRINDGTKTTSTATCAVLHELKLSTLVFEDFVSLFFEKTWMFPYKKLARGLLIA